MSYLPHTLPTIATFDPRRVQGRRVLMCGAGRLGGQIEKELSSLGLVCEQAPTLDDAMAWITRLPFDMAAISSSIDAGRGVWRIAEQCRQAHIPFAILLDDGMLPLPSDLVALGACDLIHPATHPHEPLGHRLAHRLTLELRGKRARELHLALRRRIAARNRELDQTRLEMVHRLGRAAEYRDNETGHHVLRVGKFCELVAGRLGLNGHQRGQLRHATPLHDIGKIGIADAVLLKPGPLDREERSVMERHTVIGAEILGGTDDPLLEAARVVALTHHERWDGTGYPAGLKGEEIPLYGRITAVCDVYDALTSARPYKAPWSSQQAVAFLAEQRGSHFDPMVVDAFMQSLGAVREVQDYYSDMGSTTNVYHWYRPSSAHGDPGEEPSPPIGFFE